MSENWFSSVEAADAGQQLLGLDCLAIRNESLSPRCAVQGAAKSSTPYSLLHFSPQSLEILKRNLPTF